MGAWAPNLNPGLWEVMSVNVGSLIVMNEPSPLVGDVGGGGQRRLCTCGARGMWKTPVHGPRCCCEHKIL